MSTFNCMFFYFRIATWLVTLLKMSQLCDFQYGLPFNTSSFPSKCRTYTHKTVHQVSKPSTLRTNINNYTLEEPLSKHPRVQSYKKIG